MSISEDLSTDEAAQLRLALDTRDVIGQAKGIIRFLTRTDDQQAFTLLARLSQDSNIKVRDLAQLIADCAGSGTPLPAAVAPSWRRHIIAISPQPGS